MPRAILFDLYETLITESAAPPPPVSALAAAFACEQVAFRKRWKQLRPDVVRGRLSFREALQQVVQSLDRVADRHVLDRACADRLRVKSAVVTTIHPEVLAMLDELRGRGLRLGVISNGFAEDVAAWRASELSRRCDCAVFSCEVGCAKPEERIFGEAMQRLGVRASEGWFVGDGGDDELAGAANVGLRVARATWFARRWPHYREDVWPGTSLTGCETLCRLLDNP